MSSPPLPHNPSPPLPHEPIATSPTQTHRHLSHMNPRSSTRMAHSAFHTDPQHRRTKAKGPQDHNLPWWPNPGRFALPPHLRASPCAQQRGDPRRATCPPLLRATTARQSPILRTGNPGQRPRARSSRSKACGRDRAARRDPSRPRRGAGTRRTRMRPSRPAWCRILAWRSYPRLRTSTSASWRTSDRSGWLRMPGRLSARRRPTHGRGCPPLGPPMEGVVQRAGAGPAQRHRGRAGRAWGQGRRARVRGAGGKGRSGLICGPGRARAIATVSALFIRTAPPARPPAQAATPPPRAV